MNDRSESDIYASIALALLWEFGVSMAAGDSKMHGLAGFLDAVAALRDWIVAHRNWIEFQSSIVERGGSQNALTQVYPDTSRDYRLVTAKVAEALAVLLLQCDEVNLMRAYRVSLAQIFCGYALLQRNLAAAHG